MWTKGHELKYWNKNGLRKGRDIYYNYFEAFELSGYDFDNKIIVDLGCGPFGGVVSCLRNNNSKLIPMDILAEEYNKMNVCGQEILYCDLNNRIDLDDEFCDYVICTNAIDHIDSVSHGFDEIYRILKVGGRAFVHVHLRAKKQLNKAHIHDIDEGKLKKYCSKFINIRMNIDKDWVNNRDDRYAIYAVLEKN